VSYAWFKKLSNSFLLLWLERDRVVLLGVAVIVITFFLYAIKGVKMNVIGLYFSINVNLDIQLIEY